MRGWMDAIRSARGRGLGRAPRFIALLVGVAMVVVTTLWVEHSTVNADIIIIDPPSTDCDPSFFAGLPFNPCDAFGSDPTVDDPNNPCAGLIISGQRRNSPEVVVQYFNVPNPDPTVVAPVSGLPVCILEQEIIAELAAERGVDLNAEERAEILAFGRNEIRARLFARLVNLQDRSNAGATLTSTEQGALAWAQAIQIHSERAIAAAALAEYLAWKAAPCVYVPPAPHQYDVAFDPGCAGDIGGVFATVTPPTYRDFVAYGVTRMTDGHHGAAAAATAEMAVALQIGLAAGSVGAGTLGASLIAGTLGAAFATSLKVSIFPYGAAAMAAKAAAVTGGTTAGGAAGGGVAFFAAAVAIVLVLTVVTVIRVVQLVEQAAIESQLIADVDAAQAVTTTIDPEAFLMLFADATVPIFEPSSTVAASATPDPSPADPFFTTVQEGVTTRSQSIVYRSNGSNYRAWLSDGWWVVEPIGHPDERTLQPSLMLLDDDAEALGFVSFIDDQLIVVDAASGGAGSLFVAQAPPRANQTDTANPVVAQFSVATPPTLTPTATSVTVDEGGDVTISGVATNATVIRIDLLDGPPIDVNVNPADGSFSLTRRYNDDRSFTASLVPRDALGTGVPAFVDVTVRNVDPTITNLSLTIDGAPIPTIGIGTEQQVVASVTFTDPGLDDTHLIVIEWGDGAITGPQESATGQYVYDTPGTYTIRVRVLDDDGGVGELTRAVSVYGVPRLADLAGGTGNEGDVVAITGRVIGSNPAGSFVRLNASLPNPVDHPVSPTGAFSIPVDSSDDLDTIVHLTPFGEFGQSGDASPWSVSILNVAPTITAISASDVDGQPGPFTVGEPVYIDVDFFDPGTLDTHTIEIDWGDGTTTTDLLVHTYDSSVSSAVATITVTDDDGGADIESVEIEFDVTPPTAIITLADGQAPAANDPVVFIVTFDEPVTGFDEDDVDIVGVSGTVEVEPTSDPAVYRIIVTPTSDGPFVIRIRMSGVTDLRGNAGEKSGADAPTSPTVVFIADDPNPGVNDPPSLTAPTDLELEAAMPTVVPVVVSDPDVLDGELVVTIEFPAGTLSAAGPATISGAETTVLTVTGTLADVNTSLAGLVATVDTLGASTITIIVDDQGHTGGPPQRTTAEIAVTVVDTTPPTLDVPRSTVVARTDPGKPTATVTFGVTAEDRGSPLTSGALLALAAGPGVSCTPASGSAFPIGSTTVVCTATDEVGNTATASFVVQVIDDESPVITGASDQTVQLASGTSGVVSFSLPTATDNSGVVEIHCTPTSGATLPIGTTRVTCVATDPSGNTSTVSFSVMVSPMLESLPPSIGPDDSPPSPDVDAVLPSPEIDVVLPRTGADGSTPVNLALLLIAAGLAFVLTSRRRSALPR